MAIVRMKSENKRVPKPRHPESVSYGDALDISTHPRERSAVHPRNQKASSSDDSQAPAAVPMVFLAFDFSHAFFSGQSDL